MKLKTKETELDALTVEKDREIATLQKRIDDVRSWDIVVVVAAGNVICGSTAWWLWSLEPKPVRTLAHSVCLKRCYPLLLDTLVAGGIVVVTAQASGSVQMSEGVMKLTEAAATATAAADTLSKHVTELEEKLRTKDKRIQSLTQQKAEAESQLQARSPQAHVE